MSETRRKKKTRTWRISKKRDEPNTNSTQTKSLTIVRWIFNEKYLWLNYLDIFHSQMLIDRMEKSQCFASALNRFNLWKFEQTQQPTKQWREREEKTERAKQAKLHSTRNQITMKSLAQWNVLRKLLNLTVKNIKNKKIWCTVRKNHHCFSHEMWMEE